MKTNVKKEVKGKNRKRNDYMLCKSNLNTGDVCVEDIKGFVK